MACFHLFGSFDFEHFSQHLSALSMPCIGHIFPRNTAFFPPFHCIFFQASRYLPVCLLCCISGFEYVLARQTQCSAIIVLPRFGNSGGRSWGGWRYLLLSKEKRKKNAACNDYQNYFLLNTNHFLELSKFDYLTWVSWWYLCSFGFISHLINVVFHYGKEKLYLVSERKQPLNIKLQNIICCAPFNNELEISLET